MDSIVLYSIAVILLVFYFFKDKSTARKASMKSLKGFVGLLPQMTFVLLLMGISLAVVTQETISGIIGSGSGLWGETLAVVIGSVSLIPSFIALPLGATLLENGAELPQVAGFISALMGVGIITFSMEARYFGTKFAFYRNTGSLIMTIVFVLVISFVFGDTP